MHRDRSRSFLRRTPLALALALLPVGFAAAPALAEDEREATAEEARLVEAHLQAQGYSGLHDLEVDDGRFELEAVNPAGEGVDLELDLATLEILSEDRDD